MFVLGGSKLDFLYAFYSHHYCHSAENVSNTANDQENLEITQWQTSPLPKAVRKKTVEAHVEFQQWMNIEK